MPKEKFKVGDIVVKPRNGFRRMIRSVHHDIRGSKKVVCYSYYNEELDSHYQATGNFNQLSIGYCSEVHLIQWTKK